MVSVMLSTSGTYLCGAKNTNNSIGIIKNNKGGINLFSLIKAIAGISRQAKTTTDKYSRISNNKIIPI